MYCEKRKLSPLLKIKYKVIEKEYAIQVEAIYG